MTVHPANFFSELKRRNVYKVAVACAVVAWLLIQAASILFPTFDAPPWVMKVFVTAIPLGFPVALAFALAFEITPEGIVTYGSLKLEEDWNPLCSNPRFQKIVASLAPNEAAATAR